MCPVVGTWGRKITVGQAIMVRGGASHGLMCAARSSSVERNRRHKEGPPHCAESCLYISNSQIPVSQMASHSDHFTNKAGGEKKEAWPRPHRILWERFLSTPKSIGDPGQAAA